MKSIDAAIQELSFFNRIAACPPIVNIGAAGLNEVKLEGTAHIFDADSSFLHLISKAAKNAPS